jgi:hypothetical protein
MSTTPRPRCQGKRRMWRGPRLGTYACGRRATAVVTTRVGLSRTHYVCDDPECFAHTAGGYPASSRAL